MNDFDGNRIRTTQYLGYPIIQDHSIQQKAREILKHNKRANFTRISFNGEMGSGKTSGILHLVHILHDMAQEVNGINYAVNWVDSKLMADPEKYFELIPNVNQIVISDDASYITEMMGKYAKAELKSGVTTIRHRDENNYSVTVNIIWIIVTHYTKGFDKFLRDVNFRFFTTITPEEKRSIADIVGKTMMQKFLTRSYMMEIHGKCAIQLDPRDPDDLLWYRDGDPFRLMLYSSKYGTHFCVFCDPTAIKTHQLHCNICNPHFDAVSISPDEFITSIETAHKSVGKKYAHAAIRLLLFNMGFPKYLYRHTFKAYYLALGLMQKYKLDPDAVGKALNHRQGKDDNAAFNIDHRKMNQSTVQIVEQQLESNADNFEYEGLDE